MTRFQLQRLYTVESDDNIIMNCFGRRWL